MGPESDPGPGPEVQSPESRRLHGIVEEILKREGGVCVYIPLADNLRLFSTPSAERDGSYQGWSQIQSSGQVPTEILLEMLAVAMATMCRTIGTTIEDMERAAGVPKNEFLKYAMQMSRQIGPPMEVTAFARIRKPPPG